MLVFCLFAVVAAAAAAAASVVVMVWTHFLHDLNSKGVLVPIVHQSRATTQHTLILNTCKQTAIVVYTCETFSTLSCFMFFRSFSHAS